LSRAVPRRRGLGTEQMEFPGSTGAQLAGILHIPQGPVSGSVLLAHCFTGAKDLHTVARLAGALADGGYAALRFDFTGLGESAGQFAGTTVSHDVRDLTRAAAALIERGYGPCAMVGHSLGGAATLLAAHRLKTVRSVAVIGAPSSPDHVRHLLVDHESRIRADGSAMVDIGGRPFPIAIEFLEDLDTHDELHAVADLGRPLLVVHAVDDEVVPVSEGERIFAAAAQPKGFVPLLDADHLVSARRTADTLAAVLLSWLDQTLA
jgi:alpha-beta hydrolase superfamily lysophospholipase